MCVCRGGLQHYSATTVGMAPSFASASAKVRYMCYCTVMSYFVKMQERLSFRLFFALLLVRYIALAVGLFYEHREALVHGRPRDAHWYGIVFSHVAVYHTIFNCFHHFVLSTTSKLSGGWGVGEEEGGGRGTTRVEEH